MELFFLPRKAGEMGINLGLRLLTICLFFILFFLIVYYFLVVNRNLTPREMTQSAALKAQDTERIKADALLISKVKSAIAQTKRLHGYSILVEAKDGFITLSGEVPSEIDKELAGNFAQETPGTKGILNQLKVVPGATPQPGEAVSAKAEIAVNVENLEMQANLRERIASVPELKNQRIEIKVQERAVTLSGTVATEQQRTRVEQILRGFPKVTTITNLIKISERAPLPGASFTPTPSPSILPTPSNEDQILTQQVLIVLNKNRADFTRVNAIQANCRAGEVTLSGIVPSRAERALAETLTREIPAVKTVRNLLVVGKQ